MKRHILRTPQMLAAAIAVGLKRFQIYRENINGTRILVHVINSETVAVEAFMRQARSSRAVTSTSWISTNSE